MTVHPWPLSNISTHAVLEPWNRPSRCPRAADDAALGAAYRRRLHGGFCAPAQILCPAVFSIIITFLRHLNFFSHFFFPVATKCCTSWGSAQTFGLGPAAQPCAPEWL